QDAITAMRPYAEKLTELIQNISATVEGDAAGVYAEQREVTKGLLVVITSNRGLCGAFNANVIKATRNLIDVTYAGKQVAAISIGKKGNDIVTKTEPVLANRSDLFDALTFANVEAVAKQIMDAFIEGSYDKV